VIVKNGVISLAWREPPYVVGKPPRSLRTEGTIMVYVVDRKELDRKTAGD
jgi:hypothetical protein